MSRIHNDSRKETARGARGSQPAFLTAARNVHGVPIRRRRRTGVSRESIRLNLLEPVFVDLQGSNLRFQSRGRNAMANIFAASMLWRTKTTLYSWRSAAASLLLMASVTLIYRVCVSCWISVVSMKLTYQIPHILCFANFESVVNHYAL